uniref:Uncharacterized protein n=1 Tax=Helianthus annuus TaxID=4232 RepID=A0A251TH08_HELAN
MDKRFILRLGIHKLGSCSKAFVVFYTRSVLPNNFKVVLASYIKSLSLSNYMCVWI